VNGARAGPRVAQAAAARGRYALKGISSLPEHAFATAPPSDLAGWSALFDPASLPVLAVTALEIEGWRANEDAVDAHLLAEQLGQDPLMTLKLLAHVCRACRRGDEERGCPETVTEALVLAGIGPFFRSFGPQPIVEEVLAARPEALDGLLAVLRRSRRAAAFALGFAAHRTDPDAALIHEAALLHDFAELLLWLRAPALALAVTARQRADPTLRSAAVQQELLRVTLPALQQALMKHWKLPDTLVRLSNDTQAEDHRARNVLLAIRLARHSARGWDNPALPHDLADIGELLQLGPEPTRRLVLDIDA
jgi:HD-like signal output (HDOD) protein